MESYIMKRIAPILKQIRKKRGLTQTDVAKAINKEPSYISRLENADKIGNLAILDDILNVYKINLTEILCDALTARIDVTHSLPGAMLPVFDCIPNMGVSRDSAVRHEPAPQHILEGIMRPRDTAIWLMPEDDSLEPLIHKGRVGLASKYFGQPFHDRTDAFLLDEQGLHIGQVFDSENAIMFITQDNDSKPIFVNYDTLNRGDTDLYFLHSVF